MNVTWTARHVKRKGNLFNDIISIENLTLAEMNARKGKSHQYGVQIFDKDKEPKILELHNLLKSGNYKTSNYTIFEITDPKTRLISCLPYWPDRIVHHAIMMPLEHIFVSTFNKNTYSCIKGKGIHAAVRDVSNAILDRHGTKYCLKLDIKKFYPSINHEILKKLLRKKIKDPDLLKLLDEIIDSSDGIPIGNYLSQYFANFYLTYFDHWLKEVMHVKHYFRYADDMVIFSDDKAYLHQLLSDIKLYLNIELKLTVKENYQVFLIAENNRKPVIGRGLDFLGYVFFRDHIRLRKSIKQKYFRMLFKNPNFKSIAAYNGWMFHGNCVNLINKKYDKKFSDFNIDIKPNVWIGRRKEIQYILGIPIKIHRYNIVDSKYPKPGNAHNKCMHMQISIDGIMYVTFTISIVLMKMIQEIPEDGLPFDTTITKEDNTYYKFN